MNAQILTAIIGVIGGVAGGILGVIAGLPLINYRINQLELKVDKHNNIIERTYKLEMRMDYIEKEMEVQHERTPE